MNSRVVFKCKFGPTVGWGHAIRCAALAEEFRERGWATTLWSDGDLGNLPESVASNFGEAANEPVGDAAILVIDEMYTPDEELEKTVREWRASAEQVAVGIDDMQRRTMGAFDLAINTELGLERANYRVRKSLLGERFAVLRKGFGEPEALPHWKLRADTIPVLVMIGGTDALGYEQRVLMELYQWRGNRVAPVLVVGNRERTSQETLDTLARFESGELVEKASAARLAAWMKRCRFAIAGCGTSVYEFAALQVPFIGLSLVDNQTATAERIRSVWGMPIVFREERHDQPFDLQVELDRLNGMRKATYSKVDTLGCSRICDEILACVQ